MLFYFRYSEATELDARSLAGIKFGAIGPATAAQLRSFGIQADFQPARFTGDQVVQDLAAQESLKGVHVLLPRADIAPDNMVKGLEAHGAAVENVVAYRTEPDPTSAQPVADALERKDVDWLTFTSSSTVRNFLAAVSADKIRASGARIASIGPTTSATLGEHGLAATVEADPHTIPALVEAIQGHSPQAQPR